MISPKSMIPIRCELMFPAGAFLTTPVEAVMEFRDGRSTGRQKVDEASGLRVWSVTVLDADDEVKGPAKSVKVQILAEHQPVPPPRPEGPFPYPMVEFEGMAVRPYCAQVMEGRFKVAYSIFARDITVPAPARVPATAGHK
jgi:hypothetical protein